MSSITENLGLTKPSGSDWADVAVLNENWDKIDGFVGSKKASVTVYADQGTTVKVSHSSGSYTTEVENGRASIQLPHGGAAVCTFVHGGVTVRDEVVLEEGSETVIAASFVRAYASRYAAIPQGYFDGSAAHGNFPLVIDRSVYLITPLTPEQIAQVSGGYTGAVGEKTDLWYMAGCGMISEDDYRSITGEAYPDLPSFEYLETAQNG